MIWIPSDPVLAIGSLWMISKRFVKLDGDDDGHRLLYIPDRQLEVRYLAGREVHERAAARDVSTHHLNVISGVDYNQMMRSYLEEGALA